MPRVNKEAMKDWCKCSNLNPTVWSPNLAENPRDGRRQLALPGLPRLLCWSVRITLRQFQICHHSSSHCLVVLLLKSSIDKSIYRTLKMPDDPTHVRVYGLICPFSVSQSCLTWAGPPGVISVSSRYAWRCSWLHIICITDQADGQCASL